jgi:hypothetical protein
VCPAHTNKEKMMTYGTNDEADVERIPARTTLSEGATASEVRPVGLRRTVTGEHGDRARWGPIWMGALVAVATYLLLELALLAAELLELDGSAGADLPDGAWWSVAAAVVAFFVGGLVVGASMASRNADDGVLNGIAVWAMATVILFVLAVVGTGLALATLGYAVDRISTDGQAAQAATPGSELTDAAGTAAIALGATAIAAALGALVGSKLWPRARRDDTLTFNDNDMRRSVQR